MSFLESDLMMIFLLFTIVQQDDVKILLQDAMTSKSQVTQIPARPAIPTPSAGASAQAASSTQSSASSSTSTQSCMTQPSAANQSLLKANPVGGASDAVSAVRSKVEAEGIDAFISMQGLL